MTSPTDRPPPDAAEREVALDPARSFIVQAPAGSGKTELLIRRILKMLPTLEDPEELLAITFTRKAAAEMRQRLFDALTSAVYPEPPTASAHGLQTWQLARAALDHDRRKGWHLLENPTRLQVQTIDSLCARLVRRMPLAGGTGAAYNGTDDTTGLYREAARRTLRMLAEEPPWQGALRNLLSQLDNDMAAAERLLIGMLESRELWLRHVAVASSPRLERAVLEKALRGMIEDHLANLAPMFPATVAAELTVLARYAADNLRAAGKQDGVALLAGLDFLPGVDASDLPAWLALAGLLLTAKGPLRQAVGLNHKQGFPPAKAGAAGAHAKAMKTRMGDFLDALAAQPALVSALQGLRALPAAEYSEAQWQTLSAQLQVLPLLAAQLMLVFAEQGQVDHAAVMRAAIDALGPEDEPTDLALSLDHRIRHILVDEFQDTSHGQFQLLVRLTAGWQADDGRTLFLVGDPMQSIYRFREADVGLYLQARARGVGGVRLDAVTLRANFRAHAGLVDWINAHFARVLPSTDDMQSGAIAYSPCVAVAPAAGAPAVSVRVVPEGGRPAEALVTLRVVEQTLREQPHGSIALLVAGRNQLTQALAALRERGIPVSAVEIEPLDARPVVRDLYALTRALLHPADQVAWLSVLRAPWCGLRLADLECIAQAGTAAGDTLARILEPDAWPTPLSDDGRRCLQRVTGVLLDCLAQRWRGSVQRWVEGAWLALGGPATASDAQDLADAQTYFSLLSTLEDTEGRVDPGRLRERMDKLYAQSAPAGPGTVQVMTMHGAKGLEFDTVILPGLGSRPPNADQRLLRWLERGRRDGGADLLLAPLGKVAEGERDTYQALSLVERRRDENERGRLLYVAATRARRRLHLLGVVRRDGQGVCLPIANTPLARLWPALGGSYEVAQADLPQPSSVAAGRVAGLLRLPLDWQAPAALPTVGVTSAAPPMQVGEPIEFSWASQTARLIGVVVHGVLQRLADAQPLPGVDQVEPMRPVLRNRLRASGVAEPAIEAAVRGTEDALRGVLSDTRGRWLLGPHAEAASERRMTAMMDGRLVHVAMDRTFIDDHGIRWVIDYKTGTHEGAGREAFLDSEQERYREQLERYARVLRLAGEARPVRLALYFPLLQAWREWPAA